MVTAMGRHAEKATLQEEACMVLCNLANHDENLYTREDRYRVLNRTHTDTQGGIEAVVTAMGRHAKNAKLQEEACRALGNLAIIDENQAKIGAQVENIHEYI